MVGIESLASGDALLVGQVVGESEMASQVTDSATDPLVSGADVAEEAFHRLCVVVIVFLVAFLLIVVVAIVVLTIGRWVSTLEASSRSRQSGGILGGFRGNFGVTSCSLCMRHLCVASGRVSCAREDGV